MWDLIVAAPDHCLSFYFSNYTVHMVNGYNAAKQYAKFCNEKR